MRNHYLITPNESGEAIPIGLYPQSMSECQHAIAWQYKGGFKGPFYATVWDVEAQRFVAQGDGLSWPLCAERGAFTETAWLDFQQRLGLK